MIPTNSNETNTKRVRDTKTIYIIIIVLLIISNIVLYLRSNDLDHKTEQQALLLISTDSSK